MRLLQHQKGATLIVTLVMLLVVLMLGTSLAVMAQMGEKAARNERDRQIAMHAAELALTDAERDIDNASSDNSRSTVFSRHSSEGFAEHCASGENNLYQGLCTHKAGRHAAWRTVNLAGNHPSSPSVQFGRFTGMTMPVGSGPFPARLPRYLIELLPDPVAEPADEPAYIYRITAIGFGNSQTTQIVLQSFYRKIDQQDTDAINLKAGRLSWREIPDWNNLSK